VLQPRDARGPRKAIVGDDALECEPPALLFRERQGNRWFADSPLEGHGFEPSVPRHESLRFSARIPARRA
jgi:hypothetical protein